MINEAPQKKRGTNLTKKGCSNGEREGKLCTEPAKPLLWIPSPWGAAKWDNTVGSQIQERSPPHRGAPHLPWMPSQWGGAAEVKEARRRRQRVGPPAPTWGRQPDNTCWIQHLSDRFCVLRVNQLSITLMYLLMLTKGKHSLVVWALVAIREVMGSSFGFAVFLLFCLALPPGQSTGAAKYYRHDEYTERQRRVMWTAVCFVTI